MGYYASITYADMFIPADKIEQARQAILDAGLSGWADASEEKTLATLLRANDIENTDVPGEGLSVDGFDSKYREQGEMLQVLGRFADAGWYLNWQGEDNEGWRQDAEGEHGMTDGVLQRDYEQMRQLLSRAVFTAVEDADAAGRLLGQSDRFGLARPGSGEDIVSSLSEQSIDALRTHLIAR